MARRRQITIPVEQDEWIIENCLSPSRIIQKAVREMMEKENSNKEGKG